MSIHQMKEEANLTEVAKPAKVGNHKKLIGTALVGVLLAVGGAYAVHARYFGEKEGREIAEKKRTSSKSKTFATLPIPTKNTADSPTQFGIGGDAEFPSTQSAGPEYQSEEELLAEAKAIELIERFEQEQQLAGYQGRGTGRRNTPNVIFDKSRSSLMVTKGKQAPQVDSQSPEELLSAQVRALAQSAQFAPTQTTPPSSPETDTINARLQSEETGRLFARNFQDRNFLLAKGSFLDCVLETRIDSTLPGMTSCILTRNIFSDNGRILLLERGSKVIGEYQANVQQGQARLFILWTRINTPEGVVIPLNSPGTDSLGGSGVAGHVNNKFFQRFGAAILLSVIDDGAVALGTALAAGDGQIFQFGNTASATQGAAGQVLERSLDIPPTLTKNQGELINIFVAQDVDFSGVYDVE